jgi:apolipoprotein N-acyltransferase
VQTKAAGKAFSVKSTWAGANFGAVNRLLKSRFAWAALGGLLLALSFPNWGIAGFAWMAPGLILAAGCGLPPGERFRTGFVAGLAHYLVSLYWLVLIPYRWHNIPLAPVTGWIALSAFMALYTGTWAWLAAAPSFSNQSQHTAKPWESIARFSWAQRLHWGIFAAITWVAMEMAIARFLSGFPWNLLGSSQYQMVPLIQVSSITGVYGVSFLVVWISLALVCALSRVLNEPGFKGGWAAELALPLLALGVVFAAGYRHVLNAPAAQDSPMLRTVLVQPSIPQTLIWDSANDDLRFEELLDLSEKAVEQPADLVIWPEAAVPKLLRYDQETFDKITGFARRHGLWMIIGADDAEPQKDVDPKTGKQVVDFYNSSFLINPEGKVLANYRKRALVIFGEYVPLSSWLSFLKFFTPIEGGFTRGDRPVPYRLENPAVETSVLICFEDIFPHLAREYVNEDTDFLVNLTNNGWFGEGAAQWQHAVSALFRAVENGRSLIRCSNNGLTCWVDPCGRLRRILSDEHGRIYGKGTLRLDIPIRERGASATFYNRHGDVFGWACAGWASLAFASRVVRFRLSRRKGLLEKAPHGPSPE